MRQLRRTDAVSRSGDVYADQGATITLRFPAPLIPTGTSPRFLDIEPEAGTSPEHASLDTSGIGEPGRRLSLNRPQVTTKHHHASPPYRNRSRTESTTPNGAVPTPRLPTAEGHRRRTSGPSSMRITPTALATVTASRLSGICVQSHDREVHRQACGHGAAPGTRRFTATPPARGHSS